MKIQKPKILLTCGDPNGVGPEIILKIFKNKKFTSEYNLYALGPETVFTYYSEKFKLNNIPRERFIELAGFDKTKIVPGKINKTAGKIAGDAVIAGAELVKSKFYNALVTLPISKQSLNLAGYKYSGHTDMLGTLTGIKNPLMLMCSDELIIAPFSVHIPIKKVSKVLKKNLFNNYIVKLNHILKKDLSFRNPSIAVLSLNPHSGDGGVLGDEEIKIIIPAIKSLKRKGYNIQGPFASDGFFSFKNYKNYSAIVSIYHDQGLIPFKILSGESGLNFTGGIPIIRTSPDHGTAFNIAGRGVAKTDSTVAAIEFAKKLIFK